MQGWRISMEDAHTAVLDLLAVGSKQAKSHSSQLSFFAVFDGHGGDKVALFAGDQLHPIVVKQATFKEGQYGQALKDAFLATDRAILNGKHRLFFNPIEALPPYSQLSTPSPSRVTDVARPTSRSQVRGGGVGLHGLRELDFR